MKSCTTSICKIPEIFCLLMAALFLHFMSFGNSSVAAESEVPFVKCVYKWNGKSYSNKCEDQEKEARLNDTLVVEVDHLDNLMSDALCMEIKDGNFGPVRTNCKPREIVLFMDGREMKLSPESKDLKSHKLFFKLKINPETRPMWIELLGAPPFKDFETEMLKRKTVVSVGLSGDSPISSAPIEFNLIRVDKFWFTVSGIGLLIILVLMIWLASSSDLVRDSALNPTGSDSNGRPLRKPYSLARCQMAFWFFTVVATFLVVWLTTSAIDVSGTALALIGISATTFLGAAVVDSNADDKVTSKIKELQSEATTLQKDIADIDNKIKTAAAGVDTSPLISAKASKTTRLEEIKAILTPRRSQSFIHDILTDPSNSYSLHRFQMFVWSIVLWMIFLYSVWKDFAMPEFGGTLLGLMGISGATYLGFKIPEAEMLSKPVIK